MNPATLYEIYDITYQPFWQQPAFQWAVFCLVLIVLIVGTWFFIKNIRLQKGLSYTKKALRQLAQLKQQVEHGALEPQQFYRLLTALLKTYFSKRYHVSMVGMTDHELFQVLVKINSFPTQYHHMMQELLGRAVMVKFAKKDEVRAIMEQDIWRSIDLVKLLQPEDTDQNSKVFIK